MRPIRLTILTLALLGLAAGAVPADEPTRLGADLGDARTVAITELLGNPEPYVGQTVRVEGKITDVCPMAGCWVDIEGDGGPIRFKVKDGEIVFHKEMRDHRVSAVGVFTRIDMTREEAIGYFRHFADETGKPFDESTITGPMAVYRIEGTGALVY